MKQTLKNLAQAFIGESQARNRYSFYAKVAKKEGFVVLDGNKKIEKLHQEILEAVLTHLKKHGLMSNKTDKL